MEYQFVGVDEGVSGKVSGEVMDREMRSNDVMARFFIWMSVLPPLVIWFA